MVGGKVTPPNQPRYPGWHARRGAWTRPRGPVSGATFDTLMALEDASMHAHDHPPR